MFSTVCIDGEMRCRIKAWRQLTGRSEVSWGNNKGRRG
jgi:hypothetical protein